MAAVSKITIRAATAADLDSITDLALDALPHDPAWPYRYAKAAEFPEEHYKYSRLRYSEYLANIEIGAYAIMLAEIHSNEDPGVTKVVAMSIWQLPGTFGMDPNGPTEIQKAMKPPTDYPERPDISAPRIKAWRSILGPSRKTFFDSVYGEKQLNLMVLCTRPGYQRRGAGTALLDWGKKKAKDEGLTVTLFASPQGLPLYKKNGFTQIESVHVQVDGEEEYLELPMLVL